MSKELFQNATAVAKKSGEMSVALLPLTERLIFEFVERGYSLHCDHVTPLIQGGGHDMGNLITACRACNCGKAGRTPQQWKRRVK